MPVYASKHPDVAALVPSANLFDFLFAGIDADSAHDDTPPHPLQPTLDPHALRFAHWLATRTRSFKFHPALVDASTGKTYTFSELRSRAEELARALNDPKAPVKLVPGDRMLVFSPNHIEYPVLILAAARLGVVVSTAHPSLTEPDLTAHLTLTHAKVLFAHSSLLRPALASARSVNLPRTNIFTLDGDGESGGEAGWGGGGGGQGFQSVADLVARGKELPFTQLPRVPAEAPLLVPVVQGRAGGGLKGVLLTHTSLVPTIVQTLSIWQRRPRAPQQTNTAIATLRDSFDFFFDPQGGKDAFLMCLPLSAVYGLVVLGMALAVGARAVIMARYDAEEMLRAVQEHKITYLPVVPPILHTLATSPLTDPARPRYVLSSLRVVHTGASPAPRELIDAVHLRTGALVVDGYGTTEAPGIAMSPLEESAKGSTGYLIPGTEARVVSAGDVQREVGEGVEGELLVRGPQVMVGYLDDPAGTQDAFVGDGWLRTGDLARIERDGLVTITGRIKDIVRYKGMQVSPAELETIILRHPRVAECCVVGIPDDAAGELPRALVVPKKAGEDRDALAADVAKFVETNVASYKRLRGGVDVVTGLPKADDGKVLRRVLREHEVAKAKLRVAKKGTGPAAPTKKKGGLRLKL
ncbi:acetyl-CoA synthetase-like protein [Gonapodya prolifera JEL478]|uniref:Acetyl-CoA synthetase-like protein n=1 Tax=Gonapodya prolifera (strain JEL478) TaxID=1344416 RepID=A0A139ALY2_GONPJ|nr:acetyl-CoA synthetase-like protein [Gonapodya prolifera JEL478]|eukprot:KXS17698.1 acetyl-CoA synthetase-like protein [Gonapodya prolifera JEL478]